MLSSTYQSTARPLLSTLYEPLPKHLISVLGHRPRYTLQVAVGRVRPSTPVVPCARLLGWSREPAAPSVVTGSVLVPFGRDRKSVV